MQYPRILSVLALATLVSAGCSESEGPTAVEEVSYARGGVPGAPGARVGLLTGVPVAGTLETGESFAGTLRITALTHSDGELLASGVVSWMQEGEAVSQAFENVPATLTQESASGSSIGPMAAPGARCDILFLDLGPIFLDLLGLEVDLSQIVLDIDAVSGSGKLLGNLLCAVTGLLDGVSLGNAIANLLDRINDILDDIGGIVAGVTGTVADGTAFAGDITIQSIERTAGGLQVTGLLNGIVTLADGTTRAIVDQAFTTTATLGGGAAGSAGTEGVALGASARCDILLLDVGPIFLDLLGLEVDLSQIVLDIDAVSGPGNLLGNLLCAVTGLLDGFSLLDSFLARINRLLDLFA